MMRKDKTLVTSFRNLLFEADESRFKDIVITIPKNIKWEDYEKELKSVEDWSQVMNFKVNNYPKSRTDTHERVSRF